MLRAGADDVTVQTALLEARPIVGDRKYGYSGPEPRLFLHAWKISFSDETVVELLPDWGGKFAVHEELLERDASGGQRG